MRRFLLPCLGLLLLGLPSPAASETAEELWSELMEGNAVFVAGNVEYCELKALRRASQAGQSPPVSIVSCADSRVMPEITFKRTVGEIFVTRVAGNVVDTLDLASLEFAVARGWTSLIVVMGHGNCGAISAALAPNPVPPDPLATPALGALLTQIRKAFVGIPHTADPTPEELRRATDANTRYVATQLVEQSELLRTRVAAGTLRIFTAYYDVGSGRVERLP